LKTLLLEAEFAAGKSCQVDGVEFLATRFFRPFAQRTSHKVSNAIILVHVQENRWTLSLPVAF